MAKWVVVTDQWRTSYSDWRNIVGLLANKLAKVKVSVVYVWSAPFDSHQCAISNILVNRPTVMVPEAQEAIPEG